MSDDAQALTITTAPAMMRRSRILLMGCLVLLTTVLLIDPGDKLLHAKVPCFILVMVVWLFRVDFKRPISELKVVTGILIVSLLIPAAWMLLSVVTGRSSEMEYLLAYPKAFLFITLLFVIYSEAIALDQITARASVLIALATIVVVILSKQAPALATGIYVFATSKDLAVINEARDQFGIGIGQFFYDTSPIMLFGLALFLHRSLFRGKHRTWNVGFSALMLVALVFSGSRGNFIAAALVVAGLTTMRLTKSIGVMPTAVVASVLLLAPFLMFVQKLLNPGETSNEIKLAHYQSYATLFSEHPSYLILGQGEGTRFYTTGFRDYTYVTELTYLELVRQFGIPITLILLGILIAPLILLLRARTHREEDGYVVVGYIGYLLVSATNPLLISSTGMLVVVMVWAQALRAHFDPDVPIAQTRLSLP